MVMHGGKPKKKNLEAIPSGAGKCKSKSNSAILTADFAATQQKFSPDPYDWRLYKVRGADSSSESSSIFSCSDASSSSTVSTKDSASTDDFSDYIFGEAGSRFYRRYSHSSDADASTSYSKFDADLKGENNMWRRPPPPQGNGWEFEREGNSKILYNDAIKHRRKSTSQLDRSLRETDFANVLWANPFDVRTDVSRRVNLERSAQTFYEV